MSIERLYPLARWGCLLSAAVGSVLTLGYAVFFGAEACCGSTFFYLTGRYAVDFVLAPLMVGLSLGSFTLLGRLVFWTACAWMALATWPPYLIPLAACSIWVRTLLHENRQPNQAGHEPRSTVQ